MLINIASNIMNDMYIKFFNKSNDYLYRDNKLIVREKWNHNLQIKSESDLHRRGFSCFVFFLVTDDCYFPTSDILIQ